MLKKLAQIALLGTDRSDISDEIKGQLEEQGIDTEANATQVLLEAAAVYSQKEKAGFPLFSLEEDLAEAADDEDESVCSGDSAFHLKSILEGKFSPALTEFIEYLVMYKKQLPPEMLPEIINQQIGKNVLWSDLKTIIGKRGEWLMQQHLNWRKALPISDVNLWATGDRQERVAVLKYLRGQFPELALELLQQTWLQESPRDRLAFLEIFSLNISMKDETFLEECLDEKDKDIRLAAAVLLTKIPDSRLLQRVEKRAEELLFLEKGKLKVSLPDAPDDEGTRDGLFSKMNIGKQGMRAAWLAQIVSFLPPSTWSRKWNLTPLEILNLIAQTDYANLLFSSVLLSTTQNKDPNWAEIFLWYALQKGESFSLPQEDTQQLVNLISESQYNILLTAFLDKYSVIQSNSPLIDILQSSTYRLNKENTLAIIDQYKRLIETGSNAYGNTFTQKEVLKILAYQCDFEVIDQLKKGWDMNSPLWRPWADEVEKFMRALLFRQVMKTELSKPSY